MSTFDDHDRERGSGADDAHDWELPDGGFAGYIQADEAHAADDDSDTRLDPCPYRDRLLRRERELLSDGVLPCRRGFDDDDDDRFVIQSTTDTGGEWVSAEKTVDLKRWR